ncbi:MAG TPA: hypothetical protein ENJ87_12115 [Gammaproteobacteria bacterium]|nr:hypothetical protein [Gammaproteobacteria bacterium]
MHKRYTLILDRYIQIQIKVERKVVAGLVAIELAFGNLHLQLGIVVIRGFFGCQGEWFDFSGQLA